MRMQLSFEQQASDLVDFNYYNAWAAPHRKQARWRSRLQIIIVALLAVAGIRFFTDGWDWSLTSLILGASLVYVLGLDWMVKWRVKRHIDMLLRKKGPDKLLGPRTWEVGPRGIEVKLQEGSQHFAWKQVQRSSQLPRHSVLHLDNKQALVLPLRAFESPDQQEAWQALIRKQLG